MFKIHVAIDLRGGVQRAVITDVKSYGWNV